MVTLFLTEMWERLSFYGMRALLVLYLVDAVAHGGMGLDVRTATAIYGLYVGATYLTCLPGGWLGDRLFGGQRAVIAGGMLIILGHVLLGVSLTRMQFFLGLTAIALGTGLLKSNASAMVAQLYPQGGARLDAAFTLYYVGINVGATLGPLACGALAEHYGWRAGFLVAAAGMTLGLLQFLWGRRRLGAVGAAPDPAQRASWRVPGIVALALATLIALLFAGVLPVSAPRLQSLCTALIVLAALAYFLYLGWGAGLTRIERRRVVIVAALFAASVLFWAGYEQGGSSLNLFAERDTARVLAGFTIPASWFQSLNPLFILIFAPLFSLLWLALGRRGRDPASPAKFILGLAGVALGFLVMAAAARLVSRGHLASMGFLTLTYLLQTAGELCLSPVGMSAMSQLVPRRFVGQSLGLWFLSLALGELLAGAIAGRLGSSTLAALPAGFFELFCFTAVGAVVLALLLPLLRRFSGAAAPPICTSAG
jgi:POT family proton-dependent oligopeptide transporter